MGGFMKNIAILLFVALLSGCASLGTFNPGISVLTNISLSQTIITVVNDTDYSLVIYCDGSPAMHSSPEAQKAADNIERTIKEKEIIIEIFKTLLKDSEKDGDITVSSSIVKHLGITSMNEVDVSVEQITTQSKTLKKEIKELRKAVKKLRKTKEPYLYKKGESLVLGLSNTSKNYMTTNILVVAYKRQGKALRPIGAASKRFNVVGYRRDSQTWIIKSEEVKPY
jgi:hypothetical protein